MRGLGAFDPRTRSLNGLGCNCQQNQNLSRLGFFAGRGGTNPLFRRVGRLGRMGDDDFTPAENYFLDTGTNVTGVADPEAIFDPTYDSYSNSLTPPTLTLPTNLTTPQQIAAQQIWGTTSITPAQNQALINAQTAGVNLTSMTPQQASAIKSLVAPAVTSSLLLYGVVGFGLLLLLTKK